MKDLIYYILIGGLFVINMIALFRNRKKDNFVYRMIFLRRHIDWLLAVLLIIFVITLAVITEPYIPQFLRWGLFSLLDKEGTNGNLEALNQSLKISPILVIIIFIFFMMFVPKAAYWEEMQFRYGVTRINLGCFWTNIKFGLIHCIVGVPIWIGLLLAVVGFIFNLKYIYSYRKFNDYDIAAEASSSLHGKYNILLICMLMLTLLIKL